MVSDQWSVAFVCRFAARLFFSGHWPLATGHWPLPAAHFPLFSTAAVFLLLCGGAAAGKPAPLRYGFKAGETFTLELRTKLRIERIEKNGEADRVLAEEHAVWRLDHRVIEVSDDGSARLEFSVTHLIHDSFSRDPKGRIRARFDSHQPAGQRFTVARIDKDGDAIETPSDASAFRPPPQAKLLHRRWSFRVDPRGGVRGLKSADSPAADPGVIAGVGGGADDRLAAQVAALWPPLPADALARKKWTHDVTLPLLGRVTTSREASLPAARAAAGRLDLLVTVSARPARVDAPLALLLPSRRSGVKLVDVRKRKDRFTVRLDRYGTPDGDGGADQLHFRRTGRPPLWRLHRLRSRRHTEITVRLDGNETRRRVRTELDAERKR